MVGRVSVRLVVEKPVLVQVALIVVALSVAIFDGVVVSIGHGVLQLKDAVPPASVVKLAPVVLRVSESAGSVRPPATYPNGSPPQPPAERSCGAGTSPPSPRCSRSRACSPRC